MPKKNQVPLADGSEAAPEDVVMGKEGFTVLCGHINKHFVNTDGRLKDLSCDLPKGHEGDHHAKAFKNVADNTYDLKGTVIRQEWRQEEVDACWGDAAGTPAKDIKEQPVVQLSQYQKDLVGEVLRKNPQLSVEDAIQQAKASPTWSAASA